MLCTHPKPVLANGKKSFALIRNLNPGNGKDSFHIRRILYKKFEFSLILGKLLSLHSIAQVVFFSLLK
jgi:hypothetical protein